MMTCAIDVTTPGRAETEDNYWNGLFLPPRAQR